MSEPADVIQARRIEIVDEEGAVRAVLGVVDHTSAGPVVGLTILDTDGRRRLMLTLTPTTGPELVFDHGGNNVLSLGVNDPTPDALHVGAYLHATDLDGTDVLGWHVEEDGSVFARLGGPTR